MTVLAATKELTIIKDAPILSHTRLPSGISKGSGGVTGRYNFPVRSLPRERGTELAAYLHVNDEEGIYRNLQRRSIEEGLSEWKVEIPLYEETALHCPVCGGDNLHQASVVDGYSDHERIGILYWCEHCPAEPILTFTQYQGLSNFFWDGASILKDFGVYEAMMIERGKRW